MLVSIIVAASANNVIGVDGDLPWHLPEDLKRFKQTTMGKPMIMGRLTYASIGRALPGRRSIVLTRQPDFSADGCEIASSPEEAIGLAGDVEEVMVIGGGKVYEQMLPMTDRIYLTRVQTEIEGDTFFPDFDESMWRTSGIEEFPAGEVRPVGFSFRILERTG
jgi:dihydrofolate reductase